MTVNARLRFAVVAILLSAAYYYLLVYVVGWMGAQPLPEWLLRTFPGSFVTDQIELVAAVPLVVWVLRRASPRRNPAPLMLIGRLPV